MKKTYFLALLLALSYMSAFAANYDVSVYTDGAATVANTLRWAITQANGADGNTISFSGTPTDITVVATALPAINKNMTINTGSTMITIAALAATNIITVNAGKTVTLNYLTLKNATAAALNTSGTTTVNNCVFTGNNSTNGGGTRVYGGSLSCNYCTFSGNTGATAAGIYTNAAVTISLDHCIVKNNTGPGISVAKDGTATLNISNSVISGNTSSGYGGGIASNAVTTITNTEFSGNTAARGGAVSLGGGTLAALSKLTMTGCTVSGNTANATFGGGVYIQGAATNITDNTTITNCTFSGNTSTTTGGGLQIGGGAGGSWTNIATISNSTFTLNNSGGNVVGSTGGGIERGTGFVILNYCIVAGNNSNSTAAAKDIAGAGANLGSTTGRNLYGSNSTLAFSYTGNTVTTGNVPLPYATNINTILNTSLADNGGTTLTGDGTYGYVKTHALVSPNVGIINPTAAGSGLQTTDQRGITRTLPDMGAYEYVTYRSKASDNWASTGS